MNHPVFIVGHPRSGTSILYRTLQKHSSFRGKKINLQETDIFCPPFAGLRFLGEPDEALLHYMMGDLSLYKLLQKKVYPFSVFQKFLRKIPKGSGLYAKSILLWNAALNPIIIMNYFLFAKKSRGCKRLVEKTPRHIHQIERIFSTYKDAKILIIIRHPVHTFSSVVRRAETQPEIKRNVEPKNFIKDYRRTHLIVLDKLADSRGRVKTVLYENFVKFPDKEFKSICKFLSEDYEESPILESEESLKFWKPDPFLAKPISQKTKNWNDFISQEDGRFIERNLQDVMEKYGYQNEC